MWTKEQEKPCRGRVMLHISVLKTNPDVPVQAPGMRICCRNPELQKPGSSRSIYECVFSSWACFIPGLISKDWPIKLTQIAIPSLDNAPPFDREAFFPLLTFSIFLSLDLPFLQSECRHV